ncbi:MAG TPA: EAL domain-containing protein [Solirubrobacteraceae bacterium]|nr:EAL domain-containing protein [Solirubrobacteraceae bacterium]
MVIQLAVMLFAATTLLRYSLEPTTGDGVILLCVLPIALIAMEYGIAGGTVAALASFVDFVIWDLATDAGTPPIGYATRGIAFLVLGLLVGRYATGALRRYDPGRLTLLHELRRALRHGELTLHYQPIADAGSHRIRSVEALVRWRHPRRGLIPPVSFVPVVEESDLVWDFTAHTLNLALRQARAWRSCGIDLPIAVNLSSSVVTDPRLPEELSGLLTRHRLPPSVLELEVTESAIMTDLDASAAALAQLSELGVGLIALDDFGTGHSSLARLHALPIQRLKIDRMFVRRVTQDGDVTVIEAIIALAAKLGLTTTAEGVEDAQTWERLAELGCDTAQGYCLSRPVPAGELAAWIAQRELAQA